MSSPTKDTSEVGYPCQACGRHYVTDMLVPDDVWEVIKPEGCDIGGGLLCPTCIMDRASDRLGWTVGFVYPERHGTAVTAGKSAPASEVIARLEAILASPHEQPAATERALRDCLVLISSLVAERDAARANPWCPDVCPLTGRPFFMWIDGEPTYGGPFDSYTIPKRDEIGEYSCRQFDHDEGGWNDWEVGLGLIVKTEDDWISIEDRALTAERLLAEAVEQAFRDGLAYGGNVENADPDVAWQHSKARATLSTGGVNG
jgi:hypothetical protein